MIFFTLLIALLMHQSLQLVKSHQNDDELSNELPLPIEDIHTYDELQTHIEIMHDSATFLKKDLTKAILDLSLYHIRTGLKEVEKLLDNDEIPETHDTLSKKINKCVDEANDIINTSEALFTSIEGLINFYLDIIQKTNKDPSNAELHNTVDQLKSRYQSSVSYTISDFLTELESDVETVPLNVKKCVESHLQSLFKHERHFSVLMSEIENEWSGFENEKTDLTLKIHEDSSSYILRGLMQAREVPNINVQKEKLDKISNKILGCGIEGDNIIDTAYGKFDELLEVAKQAAVDAAKDIVKRITADSTKDDDDDDAIAIDGIDKKMFKELFDFTITTDLKSFLAKLKEDSISVPLNVQKCIDEEVNFLRTWSVNVEL